MLQTLEALDAWTLILYETAHTEPSNKTFHTRVLYRPRSGMWQRGQTQIFILGAFPLKKRAADFLIESRSAPLRIGKSSTCPFSMVEVQEYPLIQPYGASCGWLEHNRWFSRKERAVKTRAQAWMSKSLQVDNNINVKSSAGVG